MVLTVADTLTIVAMATVVVAGMVAVSESVVVVAVEMIVPGSSHSNHHPTPPSMSSAISLTLAQH